MTCSRPRRTATRFCWARWAVPNGIILSADKRPERALLGLRKTLGLYANVRPVKTIKELIPSSALEPEIVSGVDLVVISELTGGIYYGRPSERRQRAKRPRSGRHVHLY